MSNWKKAITFSYDDGVTQDIRLVEIFNKYNLKATFNINSELFGFKSHWVQNGIDMNVTRLDKADVRSVYAGHEVAAHTLKHITLTTIKDDEEIVRQVEKDRQNLSDLVGYEVVGMAYPGDAFNNPVTNDHVAELIRTGTGIKYARTVAVTKGFDRFDDLYQYRGTEYHFGDWENLFDLGKRFLELKTDTPKVLYIWGHSYEFDLYPERWGEFEDFCKMISNQPDIFYGTNKEVLC